MHLRQTFFTKSHSAHPGMQGYTQVFVSALLINPNLQSMQSVEVFPQVLQFSALQASQLVPVAFLK